MEHRGRVYFAGSGLVSVFMTLISHRITPVIPIY